MHASKILLACISNASNCILNTAPKTSIWQPIPFRLSTPNSHTEASSMIPRYWTVASNNPKTTPRNTFVDNWPDRPGRSPCIHPHDSTAGPAIGRGAPSPPAQIRPTGPENLPARGFGRRAAPNGADRPGKDRTTFSARNRAPNGAIDGRPRRHPGHFEIPRATLRF